jgi:DNA-binding NarL/FixJ family response regulator
VFSPREVQVLAGITRGKSNKELATDLGLSEMAVKTHVHRVLTRAGKSPNRAAVVSWGYRNGYLQGLSKEKTEADVPKMTNRELEVLQGVVHGWDNAYIGRRIFLTEDTIKTYVRRLFKKWGADNRAHLTALAWQAGVARESWWETPAAPEFVKGIPSVPIELPAGHACPTCGSVVARVVLQSETTEATGQEITEMESDSG